MRAEYDSRADAVLIQVSTPPDEDAPGRGIGVHDRATVILVRKQPIEVELLYPRLGVDEPLAAAADRYGLDLEALKAAARSAVEAPDRVVTLEVAVRR